MTESPEHKWGSDSSDTVTLVASLDNLADARDLIEDLEMQGVPPDAISLVEPGESPASDPGSEKEVFRDVGKSVLAGALLGAMVGTAGGFLIRALTELPVAVVFAAAVFGAFVGGAAGGISVVKFSSPAWRATLKEREPDLVMVTVEHSDSQVLETVREAMDRQGITDIRRRED